MECDIFISNNVALTEFSCSSNQLSNLDVSNNTALTEIKCDSGVIVTGCDEDIILYIITSWVPGVFITRFTFHKLSGLKV